ncbi:hypothetical protein RI129_005508 [Pyrocoelia pectoralis]|uniref:Serpin domain-containing protein n=1 Tax=Pyrocoelia pectoralis TaxID=417401 RepID=A0AAN7VNK4_9COLE
MNPFSLIIIIGILSTIKTEKFKWRPSYSYPQPIPQEIMVDSVNYLGLVLLQTHNQNNGNNIALSPYGAASVLVALAEGLQGRALDEISRASLLPLEFDVMRVGLRDIHRHLKSYFIPEEGFLAGLTFSHENVTLKPSYESILRFYGYDVDNFNSALYPNPPTTTTSGSPTSSSPISQVNATTVTIIPTTISSKTTKYNDLTSIIVPSSIKTTQSRTETPVTTREVTNTMTTQSRTNLVSILFTSSTSSITTDTTIPNTMTTKKVTTASIPTTTTEISTTSNPPTTIVTTTTKSTTTNPTTTKVPTTTASTTTIKPTTTEVTATTSPTTLKSTTTIQPTTTTIKSTTITETTTSTTTTIPTTITTTTTTTKPTTTMTTTNIPTTTTAITTETTTTKPTTTETTTTKATTTTTIAPTTSNPTTTTIETSTFKPSATETETTTTTFETTPIIAMTVPLTSELTTITEPTTSEPTTTTTTPTTTTEEEKPRESRSVVDYLIARYYDSNAPSHIISRYEPSQPTTFLVNGKIRESNITFMTYDTVLPFRYISYLNALALTFPLDSTKYYLLLVLPIDETGIDILIDNMMSTTLKQIIYNLKPTRVKATIPSFMLKGYVVLTPTFQKMGIKSIFEPRHADFSKLTDDRNIYVTNIEQAITVTIRNYVDPSTLHNNEIYQRRGPVLFNADHPFLYFVMDSQIHVALMAGKIVNPLNSRIR